MTTTLDKLDTINDSLNDIKTAVIAKGQTPSGDITTYAAAISNISQTNNTTLSVTPTTSAQSFTPSSPYTGYGSVDISAVTSSIDNNIVASNIVSGVSILGVNGSATVLNGDTLSVTPTTSAQTLTPTSPKNGFTRVNVSAVTSSIDNNIQAANIVSGVSILGVNGSAVKLNGETRSVSITSTAGNTFTPSSGKNAITSITVTPTNEARTVNPSTSSQSLTVNSGYSGNGTITVNPVTASIDQNITAENIKKDVTILGVTGSLESGGGSTGKYQLLERIKDDNNNEIGTVSGFFTDANDVEYAVVCLDAQYRGIYKKACSQGGVTITNLPVYSGDPVSGNPFLAKETATSNTQKIINYCNSNNYTSDACTHCRSKSFTIDNTTYYGQLPNLSEALDIYYHYNDIENQDTTSSAYTSQNFSSARNFWSSTQVSNVLRSTGLWGIANPSIVDTNGLNGMWMAVPVLEIPNN